MEFPIHELGRDDWPPLLSEIPEPPTQMFARGVHAIEGNKILAVVGSRRGTSYGKEVTRRLIEGLRGQPVTIVSGLAIGVDSYAHEAALAAGLHTVAVPGSGIMDNVLYPRSNRTLAQKIIRAGGGLLTEFDPDFVSTTWAFPQRNRIMAGMSHATLVVEANLKSGTLITARLAVDYNRDLLVVPGSIFSDYSAGPHLFLRLGATPVTESAHILEALGLECEVAASASTLDFTPHERLIYEALTEPLSRDALAAKVSLPIPELSMHVTLLELRGVIKEINGTLLRTQNR